MVGTISVFNCTPAEKEHTTSTTVRRSGNRTTTRQAQLYAGTETELQRGKRNTANVQTHKHQITSKIDLISIHIVIVKTLTINSLV